MGVHEEGVRRCLCSDKTDVINGLQIKYRYQDSGILPSVIHHTFSRCSKTLLDLINKRMTAANERRGISNDRDRVLISENTVLLQSEKAEHKE